MGREWDRMHYAREMTPGMLEVSRRLVRCDERLAAVEELDASISAVFDGSYLRVDGLNGPTAQISWNSQNLVSAALVQAERFAFLDTLGTNLLYLDQPTLTADRNVSFPDSDGRLLVDPTAAAFFDAAGDLNVAKVESAAGLVLQAGTNLTMGTTAGQFDAVAATTCAFTTIAGSVDFTAGSGIVNVNGVLVFGSGYGITSGSVFTVYSLSTLTLESLGGAVQVESNGAGTITLQSNGNGVVVPTGNLTVTAGNLAMSSGNITLKAGSTIDGRDPSVDGIALDNHVLSVGNPHSTKWTNLGETPSSFASGDARTVVRVNSGETAVEHVADAGTAFPTTNLWDGRPFRRTDLREQFWYDSSGAKWLGEKEWFGAGFNGTASSTLRGFNGTGQTSTQGWFYGYAITLTGFDACWVGSASGSFYVKRNGTTVATINFSSATSISDYTLDLDGASGGIWAIEINVTSGTVSNIVGARAHCRRKET